MLELTLQDCVILAFGVFVDAGSVFGQTVAFQKSPSGFVSLISFINVVYALLVDAFIFEERISDLEIMAALVIFLVTVIVTVDKIRRENALKNQLERARSPISVYSRSELQIEE